MMSAPEKVLLIHGIAMRREKKVARLAQTLNALIGDRYELVPVYWGDLGGQDTYLDRVMGQYSDQGEGLSQLIQDALSRPAYSGAGRARAWVERQKGDRAKSAAIERIFKQRSENARSRVRGYMGERFQDVRLWLTQQTLPFYADIIVYQSHTYRVRIQQRVREVIDQTFGPGAGSADRPVKVIAHSLGGVITFDMACMAEDPLHLESFITLGSQPGFFHLQDPREGIEPFEGEPVALPSTIGRWTNVWDEYDVLAFLASGVFKMHDGSSPTDVRVRGTRSRLRGGLLLRSHMTYFRNKDTAAAIVRSLSGAGA